MSVIFPVQEWTTIATKIPAQRIGKFGVFKRPVKEGHTLDMHGVFGYVRCLFLQPTTITVLYEGEKDPATDPKGIWMSDSPFEYWGMWQFAGRVKPGRVLLGGLGLGILANFLAMREDIKEVVVVELSPEVIKMISPYLHPKVKVLQGDFAKLMVELSRKGEKFDSIVADIFKGVAEEKELYEDVRMTMEDWFPEAQHLFWYFQENYEDDKIFYYYAAKARSSPVNRGSPRTIPLKVKTEKTMKLREILEKSKKHLLVGKL